MNVDNADATNWEDVLRARLPLFGHRNWIVVADSAYPAQSRPGIETVVADSGQIEAVRKAISAISAAHHVRANIYVDLELAFAADADAPGIAEYRRNLDALLKDTTPQRIPHEEIIARLDRAAQLFRVLIVKTGMTLPYTSVFFELDCGYWSAQAEARLRQTMSSAKL